jgi:hypothetical protein
MLDVSSQLSIAVKILEVRQLKKRTGLFWFSPWLLGVALGPVVAQHIMVGTFGKNCLPYSQGSKKSGRAGARVLSSPSRTHTLVT